MKPHPIIDYPFRWIPMLVLALILVATQVVLVCGYTGNDYLPALVDGVATIGWLAAIAYLAWFVVGLVSLFQTDIIMIIVGSLLWLAGSFMICDIMVRIVGISYIPFAQTIPFRLLFGLPTLIAITLWYRLIVTKEEVQNQELDKELASANCDRTTRRTTDRINRSHYGERRFPHSSGKDRRTDLHTSLWRLCNVDNPYRRISERTNYEIF